MKTPEWVRKLAPDLLIHSDWEKMPEPPPSGFERAVAILRALPTHMRSWSMVEWAYALTLASITIAIANQIVNLYKDGRNASSIQ